MRFTLPLADLDSCMRSKAKISIEKRWVRDAVFSGYRTTEHERSVSRTPNGLLKRNKTYMHTVNMFNLIPCNAIVNGERHAHHEPA